MNVCSNLIKVHGSEDPKSSLFPLRHGKGPLQAADEFGGTGYSVGPADVVAEPHVA